MIPIQLRADEIYIVQKLTSNLYDYYADLCDYSACNIPASLYLSERLCVWSSFTAYYHPFTCICHPLPALCCSAICRLVLLLIILYRLYPHFTCHTHLYLPRPPLPGPHPFFIPHSPFACHIPTLLLLLLYLPFTCHTPLHSPAFTCHDHPLPAIPTMPTLYLSARNNDCHSYPRLAMATLYLPYSSRVVWIRVSSAVSRMFTGFL